MMKTYFIWIFLLMIFPLTTFPSLAQTSPLPPDDFIEEYKQEVRDNRPSISYTVFAPLINFFQSIYNFLNMIATYISETITSFLDKKDSA